MAVSGKTATYQLPYFLGTDKPPDMAAVTKAISERVEALLAKGGDVSIAADGTVTIGAGKVTRANLAAAVVQAKRSETLSIPASSNTEITLPWATEFPNTNYTVALSVRRSSGFAFEAVVDAYVVGKTKTGITVLVKNGTGSTITPVVEAIAIGD